MNPVQFIKNNKTALLIGAIAIGIYFYYTFSGGRICDCTKTEKSNSSNNHGSSGRSYFYHK